jgi:transposase InsO family protein
MQLPGASPLRCRHRAHAPTVSFCNGYKNLRVRGTSYGTRAQAVTDAFDDIGPIINRRRRHSALGSASPRQLLNYRISSQHENGLAAESGRVGER